MRTTRPWRFVELLRDAQRNVFAGASRLRISAFAAVLLGAVLTATSASDWSELSSEMSTLRSEGWNNLIVEGSGDRSIDSGSCLRVADRKGVVQAIGYTSVGVNQFRELGSASVATVTMIVSANSSIAPAFDIDVAGIPVLIGRDFASSYGRGFGDLHRKSGGMPLSVVGMLPDGPMFADYRSAVVMIAPVHAAGEFDLQRCMVEFMPSSVRESEAAVVAGMDVTGLRVSTRWQGPDLPIHPYDRFLARPTTLAYPSAGAMLGLLLLALMRSRSSEFGTYRASGTRRLELTALITLESFIVGAILLLSGLLSHLALGLLGIGTTPANGLRLLSAWCVMEIVCTLGAIWISTRPVSSLLKDR